MARPLEVSHLEDVRLAHVQRIRTGQKGGAFACDARRGLETQGLVLGDDGDRFVHADTVDGRRLRVVLVQTQRDAHVARHARYRYLDDLLLDELDQEVARRAEHLVRLEHLERVRLAHVERLLQREAEQRRAALVRRLRRGDGHELPLRHNDAKLLVTDSNARAAGHRQRRRPV